VVFDCHRRPGASEDARDSFDGEGLERMDLDDRRPDPIDGEQLRGPDGQVRLLHVQLPTAGGSGVDRGRQQGV
jgi:hypothetical protein